MNTDPVLITGVGRRLGLKLAHTFLDRGYPVIGTYRTHRPTVDGLAALGAELHRCDFNDPAQVEGLVGELLAGHDSLRAVIHNASDWLPDNCDLAPAEIMDRMMNVHVNAPYQLNLMLAPLLQSCSDEHADIIHVGDFVSSRGSTRHIAYAASKAAQDNLTYSFSTKLGPKVKVNSIAPALVMFNQGDCDSYRENAKKKSIMQREGGFDEFRHAVDYLLASRYVTGRVLPMDGGRHLKSGIH